MLLGLELVADEVLDVIRLGGSGELTLTEFLSVKQNTSATEDASNWQASFEMDLGA